MKLTQRLSNVEVGSSTWNVVSREIEYRIGQYSITALNPTQSEADRLAACWRIKELKELLKLAEPAKEQTAGAGE
jgi:hypothetical protein